MLSLDAITQRSDIEYALSITIADGVYLGSGTTVCSGVTIR
jgi:acetyltransferase-like isoleucine patch superfamily enzyme